MGDVILKNRELFMKAILLLFAFMFVFDACSMLNRFAGLPDDHPIEEAAEEIIKQETEISLDLTPESLE